VIHGILNAEFCKDNYANLCHKVNEQFCFVFINVAKATLPNACPLAFFFTLHILLCNIILGHTETVAFISIGS